MRDFEVNRIVNIFRDKEAIDDFSVAVPYDKIKEQLAESRRLEEEIMRQFAQLEIQ